MSKLWSILFLFYITACTTAQETAVPTAAVESSPPIPTVTWAATSSPTAAVEMPSPTLTGTSTPEPAISETAPAETATPAPSPTRPSSYLISPIKGQRQAFPLSCESRAAVDWAAYYGFDILEGEFQFALPFSADNPDLGFVGVTTGLWGQVPPYDYGVHAAPVAQLLRDYGVPAVAVKEFDLEALKDLLAQGHPVITWVIGNVVGGVPYTYTDSLGNQVTVAAYEHVVIVIGYDDEKNTLTYMNNGKYYAIPADVFENSWSILGHMAIYYDETSLLEP